MEGVGILGTIIVGGLAGWIASRFTKAGTGLVGNVVLGILGAVVAGWIAGKLDISLYGWLDNIIGGALGAALLITGWRAFRRN